MIPRPVRSFILSFSILFLLSASSAAHDLAERVARIKSVLGLEETVTATGAEYSHSGPDWLDGFHKCGFPYAYDAYHLHQEYGTSLGLQEALIRPSREEFEKTYASPSNRFLIHYTTTPGSRHIVKLDDANANGIPDYIEITARIADSVWNHQINVLGYHPPLPDGQYTDGDDRYDIYVLDVPSSVYGITTPDTAVFQSGIWRAPSWIQVDTRYETYFGYQNRPLDALRVTIAHEFFHAVQLWYDASEPCTNPANCAANYNPYWFEMSAVWMEEEMYDHINDYYYYLPSYFNVLHRSPRYISPDQLNIYGAGIVPLFWAKKHGPDVIRKIWERCGDQPYENFLSGAVQGALAEYGVTLEQSWTEFSRWMYFTGHRARPGQFFEEAADYPVVRDSLGSPLRPYIRYYDQYPITEHQSADNGFPPSELGINYMVFRTQSLDSAFSLSFNGVISIDPSTEWRISVMGVNRGNPTGQVFVDPRLYQNRELIQINNLTPFTDIVVVPTIVNPELRRLTNAYRFSVSDTSIVIEEDVISYGPTRFKPSDASPFQVFLELVDYADVAVNIFSAAGERVFESPPKRYPPGFSRPASWDGRNEGRKEVASGVYILQIRVNDKVSNHKILVIR